jgi:hypothetical protein
MLDIPPGHYLQSHSDPRGKPLCSRTPGSKGLGRSAMKRLSKEAWGPEDLVTVTTEPNVTRSGHSELDSLDSLSG